MSNDDHEFPAVQAQDAVDAAIEGLLDGPSPVNMVHGALKLDGVASGVPRPCQAAVEAARNEILAALWGESL